MKNKEEHLRRSEEKYKLLVEGVKDYAIFMLSSEGFVETWNDGAFKLKGYTEQEIVGKHFSIFYPEEAKLKRYPQYELEQATKIGRFEDEGWRVRKNGTLFFANVIITAMRDSNAKLLGFSKITRDLTEKKITEEQLRKSEERYRLLVEGVKDYAIFLLDPNGFIISWNEGAKRLKGYTEQEILGKHISIFYPDEKNRIAYPQYELDQAAKFGKFEDEGFRVRKDQTLFYANVIITALYADGELIGFSKITRDLTERKLAEEKLSFLNVQLENKVRERTNELSQTVKELKMINADLDNFIYTASHDLKAPLANIEGLIYTLNDTLKENKFGNTETDQLFSMISESVQRFQTTIKDLAAVNASQHTGKDDVDVMNMTTIIQDVIASIDHLIRESKAQIVLQIDEEDQFHFSKIHIRSIVFNLLSNAIKYRSPDRPLHIIFSCYWKDGLYHLKIIDNGLGFKDENKEKVFQLFKRLHSHVDGSGIGLYIIKKIIDNVGGSIEVISRENEGTTFHLALPDLKKTDSLFLY